MTVPQPRPSTLGVPQEVQSGLRALFEDRVKRDVVPGSLFAVFTSEGITCDGAFGTASDDGTPPTLDTAFRVASCTKSVTAAAILQLRDSGALALSDPVSAFVDVGEWDLPGGPRVPAPPLSALMSMSAGLAADNAWADRQESMPEEEFTDLCRRGFTLASHPGTRYAYSNLGYALLGRVVHRVTGMPYRDYVARHLLTPLALRDSAFDDTVEAADGIAIGFRHADRCWTPLPFSAPGAFSPIGGLFMTARDLTSWCSWLASGYPLGADDGTVLCASSRREMQRIQQFDPSRTSADLFGAGYGYGLDVEYDQRGLIVSHRGGYPGFSCQMAWHPDTGFGVVVLENGPYAQSPAGAALRMVLDVATRSPALPDPWPATLAARMKVEHLLAYWDDATADQLFATNVDLDEPRAQRRTQAAALAAAAGFDQTCLDRPIEDCNPVSSSAAQLTWTARGRHGRLRCSVALTSQHPPLVQSLTLQLAR